MQGEWVPAMAQRVERVGDASVGSCAGFSNAEQMILAGL